MHLKPLLQSLLDLPRIFIDYPQSRHVFHLLGERMLLIEAETATTLATLKMVKIKSPYSCYEWRALPANK